MIAIFYFSHLYLLVIAVNRLPGFDLWGNYLLFTVTNVQYFIKHLRIQHSENYKLGKMVALYANPRQLSFIKSQQWFTRQTFAVLKRNKSFGLLNQVLSSGLAEGKTKVVLWLCFHPDCPSSFSVRHFIFNDTNFTMNWTYLSRLYCSLSYFVVCMICLSYTESDHKLLTEN